jgi:para-aminobenzoate synthetase component 1
MAYCISKSHKLKLSPFEIFSAFSGEKNVFFLNSNLSSCRQERFSFLGIEPYHRLWLEDQKYLSKIKEFLPDDKSYNFKNKPPFLGGAVGYLAYDRGLGLPKCYFAFYNTFIAIDHLKKELHIFAFGFPEKKSSLARLLCRENLRKAKTLLARAGGLKKKIFNNSALPLTLKSSFSQPGYIAAIKQAKEYIKAGDVYQVNLSQRFQAEVDLSSLEIYRRLHKISPVSFGAYLDAGNFQILSASPERFLKLEDNVVLTSPMKGTRPRGKTPKQDLSLSRQLIQSPKDKAELLMIVDLERNDLGRVCEYGSVKVDNLRRLEKYRAVFQTTAVICGLLHRDKDRIDLLRAAFPGGSITGCPKIRAMEIIRELEPCQRSIYTGCLGYLSFCGNMDFNIMIRTILKKGRRVYFGAGGGIVADSDPLNEYQETLTKAKAMIEALS